MVKIIFNFCFCVLDSLGRSVKMGLEEQKDRFVRENSGCPPTLEKLADLSSEKCNC
jgi:hypothetical protein